MSNNIKSITTSMSSRNKFLESLLYDYQYNKKTPLDYDLFQIMSIAFLKENNETLTTLKVNNEFRQELFFFVNELLEETKPNISNLINQFNKANR